MRTFIAIPLPDECRATLGRIQQKMRVYQAEVRWVAIPSIHLTLKFLGDVDPAIVQRLADDLGSSMQMPRRFSLRIRGLGCFPNQKNPRIVWCGIEGEMERLSQLQQQVEKACERFGFAPEDRSFRPHLTLGRISGKRNLQPLLDCIKMGLDFESSFESDHFNIYKSILKPEGAVYTVFKTIALNVQGNA